MDGVVGIRHDDAHSICLCRSIEYRVASEGTRATMRNPRSAAWYTRVRLRYIIEVKMDIVITGDQLDELKGFIFNNITVLIVDSDVGNPGE